MTSLVKYSVTFIDKHGDEDVVDVYAANADEAPAALDRVYGDDYQTIIDIEGS